MKSPATIKILPILAVLPILLPFVLAGCDGTKEQLGLGRQVPDEFAVVKKAPLTMPPDYSLRPPQPGAPRPQEKTASEKAFESLSGNAIPDGRNQNARKYANDFESASQSLSDSEIMFLQQAGAHKARPGIRELVDQETAESAQRDEPVVQKLMGIEVQDSDPEASIVDAPEEFKRIQRNKEEGKDITEGETPSKQE